MRRRRPGHGDARGAAVLTGGSPGLLVYTLDVTEGSLEITPGGAVYAMFGSATGYTSLAGISYLASV